jgi:glycyl-tRNA synthetase beta chain
VRPLHSIVALLGEEIVPVSIDGIASGATTVGHRFHHPGPITIGGAHDYAEKLRACHVIVDHEEREKIVREGAERAASKAKLQLVEDEGLVVENAGLTEWPVPLVGKFDPEYLDVPREVIVLTMRTNQKYFACTNGEGMLAPAFVCVANIEAKDGGEAIVEGNRRVLAARLADARFFWEQDVKIPLQEQATKLRGIVFHAKLGTVADKVERFASVARRLAEEDVIKGADPDQVERAARLAKADLVSGLVGEFPELQGVIGGYLAKAQGESKAISDAIRDHYKPAGVGDQIPTEPVTVAVSLADKLDTLLTFAAVNQLPTGSKDPYAIRRSILGILRLITTNNIRVSWRVLLLLHSIVSYQMMNEELETVVSETESGTEFLKQLRTVLEFTREQKLDLIAALLPQAPSLENVSRYRFQELNDRISEDPHGEQRFPAIMELVTDRLKVQQRDAGIRYDLVDAVFALGGEDDLVRLLARVQALQAFVEHEDGSDLLTSYKRAANILKKEKWEPTVVSSGEEMQSEEMALIQAIEAAEHQVAEALESEDFMAAMRALAKLRRPIDAFFDKVTVNDPDPAKRERRLNLLAQFRDAVHRVADFSKIEG